MRRLAALSLVLLAPILAAHPFQAFAQPSSLSAAVDAALEEYGRCIDEAGFADWQRASCALSYLEVEAQLHEKAFNVAIARLDEREREQLHASEHRWKKIRAKCYDSGISRGTVLGAGELERYKTCVADRDRERIYWLEKHYPATHGQ